MTWRNEKPHSGPWKWADGPLVDGDGDRILECTNDAEEVYTYSPADAALIADAPAMLDWLRTLTQDGPPRCICPANDCIHTQAYYTVRMWLLDKHGRGP